jgi:squalene synthase HpnC
LVQASDIVVDTADKHAEPTPQRSADTENFPVGSWLLPARLRRHIMLYYRFARAADDIADDPERTADQKIAELDAMDAALSGAATPDDPTPAERKSLQLKQSMAETDVPIAHGTEILRAFRQDAVKPRYEHWSELMDYCRYSAAPVGRYLLDLHGESRATWPASDALCGSLQVLNHIQDCQIDFQRLDRVYLPLDWFDRAKATVDDLNQPFATPAVRKVIDLCLDGCDQLNRDASALPGLIRNRRMRMEAAVIVAIAHRLTKRLRRGDPVARRIELGLPAKLACLIRGIWAGLW